MVNTTEIRSPQKKKFNSNAVDELKSNNSILKGSNKKISNNLFSEKPVSKKSIFSRASSEGEQVLTENTKIAINKAFQKEFEKSLNKGFPLSMLINDTIIQLNTDNTYEVTPIKRELNTITEIYLK